jgi:hypothetical protein
MYYWAPKVTWKDRNLSPASDVWGVGAILHEFAHNFIPLVDPAFTKMLWVVADQFGERSYPAWWTDGTKRDHWAAKSSRKVIALNLNVSVDILDELDPKAAATRSSRPSPRGLDELSHCVIMALRMNPQERAGVGEAYAKFKF